MATVSSPITAKARLESPSGWTLELVDPEVTGVPALIPLPVGETRIGREPTPTAPLDVVFASPHISRKHASIIVEAGGEVVLRDESSNGCRVSVGSGQKLVRKASSRLPPGCEVLFGLTQAKADDSTEYRYRLLLHPTRSSTAAEPASTPVATVPPQWPASAVADASPTQAPAASQPCSYEQASIGFSEQVLRAAGADENRPILSQPEPMDVDDAAPLSASPAAVAPADAMEQGASRGSTTEAEAPPEEQPQVVSSTAEAAPRHAGSAPPQADAEAPQLLRPQEAAESLGYEEVDRTFTVRPDGSRVPLEFEAREAPPADAQVLDYASLRAMRTTDGRGWGLACAGPVAAGTYIVEMVGRVVSEETCSAPGFDSKCDPPPPPRARTPPPLSASTWPRTREHAA